MVWDQRIPRGELIDVLGDPGVNKSTFTIDLAARISSGRPMPDGTKGCPGASYCWSVRTAWRKRSSSDSTLLEQIEPHSGARRDLTIPKDLAAMEEAICKVQARIFH